MVVEGAAGAGKTTALRSTQTVLARQGHRLLVVTPTLKAAEVAAAETGADGHSAAWLIHQHGWRWDDDGHWTRRPDPTPDPAARLRPGDLLLVDEAGMLDQDTARALLTIADETGARVALVGDRHQLPAVGRGGVLDHAVAWAHPTAVVTLETVHRFTDPDYAALTLRMRTGDDPAAVFDTLHRRGQVVVHPTEVERTAALAEAGAAGDLVIADTREQVATLNAAIRDQRRADPATATQPTRPSMVTARGERIGLGDRVATRRNDPDLGVANRQTWTVTGIGDDGSLILHGHGRDREIPAEYATRFVELAYATTVHGAQGETVDRAHVAIGDTTGAAAAYVAMTRGRTRQHRAPRRRDRRGRPQAVGRGLRPRPRRPRPSPRAGGRPSRRSIATAPSSVAGQWTPDGRGTASTDPGIRRRDQPVRSACESVTPLAPADWPPLDADLAWRARR